MPKFSIITPVYLLSQERVDGFIRCIQSVRNQTFKDFEVIVVDYWTDSDNWYLVADPNYIPTIELGFLNGKQEPELLTQNDPTVGSVFTADKISYKIRHIYGGAVLDFRGFYGEVVG